MENVEIHILHYTLEKPMELLLINNERFNGNLRHVCENCNRKQPASFIQSTNPEITLNDHIREVCFTRIPTIDQTILWVGYCRNCKTVFVLSEDEKVKLKNGNVTKKQIRYHK